MIIPMTTTGRRQRRYDHRLRDLVQRTGDVTIAKDLGVPRSTARGWLGDGQTAVVSLDVASLKTLELEQEVLELRRRLKKLTALLRLVLALLRTSGFTLTRERLPDGRAKIRILRAIDRARAFVPLPAILRFMRLSPSRFHAWRRLQRACALDDQPSCPHTSPHRLTSGEIRVIKDMVPRSSTGTSRQARWLCLRSGSARSGRRLRRGTARCGSTAGGAHGSACTRPSRRSASERPEPTKCGISTPPSSACLTARAPTCTR